MNIRTFFLSITVMMLIFQLISFHSFADIPTNVRITNIRGTQFSVSWITTQLETGKIRYGDDPSNSDNWQIAYDDRGETIIDDIHYITLIHLRPETIYYFDIISGDTIDNQNDSHYDQQTCPILDMRVDSCFAMGRVLFDASRQLPAYDSIIFITIHNNDPDQPPSETESCILSQANVSASESCSPTLDNEGNWGIEMVNAIRLDHGSRYDFSCDNSRAHIEVESGKKGFSERIAPLFDFVDYQPTIMINDKLREVLFLLDFLSQQHNGFLIDYFRRYDRNQDRLISLTDILIILESLAEQ
jgi:hypothetical protein